MENKKRNIAIISENNSQNIGDRAIFISLCQILKKNYNITEVPFGTIGAKHNHDIKSKRRNFLLKIFIRSISSTLKSRIRWYFLGEKSRFENFYHFKLRDCDLAILGGGQLIKNNIALFCEKISAIEVAHRSTSCALATLGVGIDKHMTALNWITVRTFLKKSHFIGVRDHNSKDRLRSRHISDCFVTPDLAFALRLPYERKAKNNHIFGINIMNFRVLLRYSLEFNDELIEIIRDNIRDIVVDNIYLGKEIVIFTTGSDEDLEEAENFREYLADEAGVRLHVFHPSSFDHLMEFLSSIGSVMALRMHAGILGYVSRCNVLAVNWDDKVAGVWAAIGQGERVIEISELAQSNASEMIFDRFSSFSPPSIDMIEALQNDIYHKVNKEVGSYFNGRDSE